tara:strand:+ start:1498 stop:1671 length:174 start_codon:yes stop_codon:yes gene_type:complete
MPNIMTAAESDYTAAYSEYMKSRVGFYNGTVSAQNFINLRNVMETKMAEWEAERIAA